MPSPLFTAEANERWCLIRALDRDKILKNAWCGDCKSCVPMSIESGKMVGRSLVLHGTCLHCGKIVARVVEPDD